eukprot:2779849-Amphidinium_carterae.1
MVETTGAWPQAIKEMLYLQLPKEGARDAGERRPIALLPQSLAGPVYRPRRSASRQRGPRRDL